MLTMGVVGPAWAPVEMNLSATVPLKGARMIIWLAWALARSRLA